MKLKSKSKLKPILLFCSLIAIGSLADFETDEILTDVSTPNAWFTIDNSSVCQPQSGSRYIIILDCKGVELSPSIEFDGDVYHLSFQRRHLQYTTDVKSNKNFQNLEADVALRHFSMSEIQHAASNLKL